MTINQLKQVANIALMNAKIRKIEGSLHDEINKWNKSEGNIVRYNLGEIAKSMMDLNKKISFEQSLTLIMDELIRPAISRNQRVPIEIRKQLTLEQAHQIAIEVLSKLVSYYFDSILGR